MKKLIFALVTLLTYSCSEKPKSGFSMNGTTTGIENGTVLYLESDLDGRIIDSTIVESNSFKFQTKLSETPIEVMLRTKDDSQYRYLWLENNPMTFTVTEIDFRNADVTGSATENLEQSLYKGIDTLPRQERRKLEMEFVYNNPNSIVSASILSVYTTTWGKEKTSELFDQFSPENKNSEYGKMIANYIKFNQNPKIGEQFVDFEMPDRNGNLKKLSDLKGKIILLEFWSSGCSPCRKENPNLVKTYEAFNKKGFEIFAVSEDENKESWIRAIEMDGLNWIHVSDLKNANMASLIYGVHGIPDNFLIDRNGVIIGRNLRGDELNKKIVEIIE
jgi:peroxiredoxin